MKKQTMGIAGSVLAALVAFAPASAPAEASAAIERYDLRVMGLACPFCTFGIEKKLKALPGVADVKVDLEGGRVQFEVTGARVLMPQRVREAIREAGFSPGAITITASGVVEGRVDQVRLRLNAKSSLQIRGGKEHQKIVDALRRGKKKVGVTGPVTAEGGHEVLGAETVKLKED